MVSGTGFNWAPGQQAWAGWSNIAHQLNTLFPGPFQGPHIKEDEVNDVKLKLMKLLKGYFSFFGPFLPLNKVLAEVSVVLYKPLVYVA